MDREHAYRLLFGRRKTLTWVWRWLRKLGVARRARADVRQDVFLEARRSWDNFDPTRARPERWLNTITVHVAARYNARAVHRREALTACTFANLAHLESGPDEQIAAEECRLVVLEKLELIDQRCRAVIVAHDIDEIPMTALATRLGAPVSTIYKWRARGLDALRALIAEEYR